MAKNAMRAQGKHYRQIKYLQSFRVTRRAGVAQNVPMPDVPKSNSAAPYPLAVIMKDRLNPESPAAPGFLLLLRGQRARMSGYRHRDLADLCPPLARAGLVHRVAAGIDRHRHRHILHVEFVDGFHAEILEREHTRSAHGF